MGDLPELIALITGVCLVAFLLLQLMLLTYLSARRLRADAINQRLALREWHYRIKAAELQVAKAEESTQHWSGWRKFEIRRKQLENEAKDICSFYLYPHDRRALPPFRPGQFLMVKAEIPDPDDPYQTIEESRCYSLSDSHNPRYYRVSIKAVPPPRDVPDAPPGMVSSFFHQHLNEGDLIDVMAPSGDFFLDLDSSSPVVLIAGGVGITPILSMANSIVDRQHPRETWIFYGVRGRHELVMFQALRHAVEHMPNVRVFLCYSDGRPEDVEDVHGLENSSISHVSGRVSVDLFKKTLPSNNYDYYICGPEVMMISLRDNLLEWGVPRNHIHYELFAPAQEETPADTQVTVTEGTAFTVRFAALEKELSWAGEKNLLSLTKKHKLTVKRIRYTCKQGKCGSCQTAIRSGAVSYPATQPTFQVQEGHCLPCICIPASDLELEA